MFWHALDAAGADDGRRECSSTSSVNDLVTDGDVFGGTGISCFPATSGFVRASERYEVWQENPNNSTISRMVHQLKMTTWIMQNIEESEDIAAEYEARMRTIRDGKPSTWAPR